MISARNVLTLRRFAELTREKKLVAGAPELRNVGVRAPAVFKVERVAGAKPEDETFRFVISNGDVDRYDSTVNVEGWKLEHYRMNPVVMWAHQIYSDPPIGRSVSVGVEGKELVAEVEFVKREVYPFAGMVRDLVAGGFLRAASVSWDPIKWVYNEGRSYWAVDYLEQELLEWSIVPVGGNAEALIEARAAGVSLDPLAGWAEEQLDALVGKQLSEAERRTVGRLEALRRVAGREKQIIVDLGGAEQRILAAAERLEKIAAAAETREIAPAITDEQSKALVEAIKNSARAATKEFVTSQTGRLD